MLLNNMIKDIEVFLEQKILTLALEMPAMQNGKAKQQKNSTNE